MSRPSGDLVPARCTRGHVQRWWGSVCYVRRGEVWQPWGIESRCECGAGMAVAR